MDGDTSSDETSVAIAAMQEQAQAHAGQAVQTRAHHQFEQPPQQDVVYVPLWSNLQLPQQAHSTVARAAHYLRSDPSAVPENAALMPSKRRGNNVSGGYLAPGDMQTLATYEAYAALFVVTVLHCESDVPRFVAAEHAEFEDAAAVDGRDRRFPSRPQCSADSRHLALTLLVHARVGQSRPRIEVGETANSGAVGVHGPEIGGSVPVALEDDRGTVRTPLRIVLTAGVARQASGPAALEGHLPEVAAPAEDHGRTVGADAGESRQMI